MRLDDRVTVLSEATSTDEYGETTTTYSEGEKVWANVTVSPGSETRFGGRAEESTSIEVGLRTPVVENQGITHTSRLRWRGDDLQVQAVENERRNSFTTLYCTRVRP